MTTATDVYSLGVVLYQLLTGVSPYGANVRTLHEISCAIAYTEPLRPSSVVTPASRGAKRLQASEAGIEQAAGAREANPTKLRRRLAGDIDSILLMALRKEPELRYGSVEQFAEDISRHLNGLPVTARKGSWSYFARKFVARNRTVLAAAALVILALAGGIATTARQARIAQMERARAQKRFDDVRRFSDSLIFDIHDALQAIPGTTSARSLLLDRAVQYLDNVSKDAEGDSALQRELAMAYQRLATVQGDATVSNTGQISAAEVSTRKTIALFESVARANPANTIDQLNVAIAHRRKGLSDIYYPDGRPELDKAIAITDRLMLTDGANPKVRMERAVEYQGLGMSYDVSGDRAASVEFLQKALAIVESVEQSDPSYPNIRHSKAKFLVELGDELAYTGDLVKARQQSETGVAAYQAIVDKGAQPDTVRDLSQSYFRLARIDLMENDLPTAIQNFGRSRAVLDPLTKADGGNILFRTGLLSLDFQQARLLVLEESSKEGETRLQRVIADFVKLGSEEDSGPGNAVMLTWLGEAQFDMKEYAQALGSFQKAIAAIESDVQYDDGRTGLITDYVRLGDTQLKLGHISEAETAYNKARSKTNLAEAKTHRDIPALYSAAEVDRGLAEFWIEKSSNPEERIRAHEKACDIDEDSHQTRSLILAPFRFSPNEFPIVDSGSVADYSRICGKRASRAML
jgi:tetratricopeptide (TPR) repeat protein